MKSTFCKPIRNGDKQIECLNLGWTVTDCGQMQRRSAAAWRPSTHLSLVSYIQCHLLQKTCSCKVCYDAVSCKRNVLGKKLVTEQCLLENWSCVRKILSTFCLVSPITNCALGTWHWHVFLIFAFFLRHRSILLRTVASGLLLQQSIYKTFDWALDNIPPWYCCVRQIMYFLNWKLSWNQKKGHSLLWEQFTTFWMDSLGK